MDVPENLNEVEFETLILLKDDLITKKLDLRREINLIDTELIGIKEELRVRREKQLDELYSQK